ncbi:DUF4386 domain-containing protein [Tenacibaculum caenipelagi]|uniref:Uncharacterized protein DUF4386 n=1 Tax=Tenacibaculum caenipelagi TaxID=1325435 RepID=A0A4R6TFB6_9FLAO|nr:DUF4386 domain-containing protein [Tenacibaculum caenipelagi]TDQ24043.1 uncharacterized protein DUF4386 [Tenacibaculum caenipelagi]
MEIFKNKVKIAGLLIILGMITGVLSIASAVDSSNYLTEACANTTHVLLAALFQFILFLTYVGFAILLYPIIKKHSESLALGFLSFRITAGIILIIGTVILLSILTLSCEFVKSGSDNMLYESIGNILKISRDQVNHIFMVITISTGNLMLYILFLRSKLIPKWLSIWAILGTILSTLASILLLFSLIEVITIEYVILNVPTGLFELVLGFWLIVKDFEQKEF